jgi:hypothetical protein
MTDTSQETPGTDGKKYWLDNRRNVDKIYWSIVVICAALFIGDALYHKHPHFSVEKTFGFYGIFGFCAFVFIVVVAKQLRKVLMRGEDFYTSDKDES